MNEQPSVELAMLGDRLLVQLEIKHEHTLESGVIALQSYDPGVIGTVVNVGPDVVDVKTGDVVLFAPESGRTMEIDHVEYLVLDETDVLAVWDSENQPI